MRPNPALLEQLMTAKLVPSLAQPSVGTGERRSRTKGPGIEFIDHRPYQPGDDTRHLDAYVMARSGEAVIREYALMRQVPITIVLDTSASMAEKRDVAGQIAQVFGFVGLAAGDRVQVAAPRGGALHLGPRLQGTQRAEILFDEIATAEAGPALDLTPLLRAAQSQRGLMIIISDWWDEGLAAQLPLAAAAGQEVLGIQLLAPIERDPTALGQGVMTLEDQESGAEIDVRLDSATLSAYTRAVTSWQQDLGQTFRRFSWHFLTLGTEDPLDDFFLRRCRGLGILT
ncbi:DUF58 domain-containing protein [Ketogulonicigenium vulgare]|uniref:DUF58 domain-containing protein n=1 Tax=Ketogulonicigenium vulgare (strain WSH-001) TaxID=759362 RepID=F9Y5R2_KETVW|nr:DUF58 domain-containing protein [Ketogulonicigenium vulgare]ADO43720.1 conserved hypothetical protein [Ketogulonicigenium vulgare Y25]AEM41987.1 hypothetical protein KVU_2148 [Ketogulonicigenium vulgare WSH-001]ALJ82084.1 hypothetical protein KVH_13475 [Ketogulonicigenium vulgare]ANW34708.1 hypothetical protein KvSKV_13385 [Ketogulonicigenium vulgare]AOZ55752.1 hypothetical protein KVC_2750 [Ketogulonicigenium vulgare]